MAPMKTFTAFIGIIYDTNGYQSVVEAGTVWPGMMLTHKAITLRDGEVFIVTASHQTAYFEDLDEACDWAESAGSGGTPGAIRILHPAEPTNGIAGWNIIQLHERAAGQA